MKRRHDWPECLIAFRAARARVPFAWGTNDCVTLAADWVIEATGVDPLGDLRGTWSTEYGAVRILKSLGGLGAAITHRMGAELDSPSLAQRGDLVLLQVDDNVWSCGVVVGTHAIAPGADGILLVPMSRASAAWRV